jgi:ribosomal-protein-alanine N-acetyltransferase
MDEKKSMHFIMLNDSKSEILGVCNYTKIKDGACWLGYSISSKYERMGIMYEAVVGSNNYIFTQYPICQINAGVITRNKRSIKLINRLFFKPTGNFQKMEINRKVEQLEIYNLNKPDK